MFGTWSHWKKKSRSTKRRPAVTRRRPLRLEALEDRAVPSASWSNYAHDPQHTDLSEVPSQSLDVIRWQTPVDLNPQYSGGGVLYIHYGSPIITQANTVIIPVKTGKFETYRVE